MDIAVWDMLLYTIGSSQQVIKSDNKRRGQVSNESQLGNFND